jgi:plastocyanin|tara:strand:- start:225 stop:977 length:753 start_codon:yes stop_codon:yes gene_type:complete
MDSCRSLSKNSNLGDSSGDTVQCRMEQLRLAIDDSSFCSGAAPESAVCIAEPEPSCDEYCGRVVDVCGTTGEDAQYESERACLDFCSAEDIPIGSREDTTGNSLGCRLSHLIIAETVDTVIHCPHAGKTGADVCSDRISLEPLSTATDTEEVTIRIADMAFTPLSVEISVGTKVTWINDDTLPHRVTDRYGYIRSPTLYQTETFSKTFTEVGTYEINCAIHPSMQHTIVVAGEQLAPARNLFDVIRDIFT